MPGAFATFSATFRRVGRRRRGFQVYVARMECVMTGRADCAICRQPLPTNGPVAFVDKQRLIHMGCYRAPVPLRRGRGRTLHSRGRRLRT
jgi:hypothetical protein